MEYRLRSNVAPLREQSRLTQVQLAALVGVTTNTIQNWEKDEGLDQLERYLKLAEILGCEVKELVELIEVEEQNQESNISFSLGDLRNLREKWKLRDKGSTKVQARTRSATDQNATCGSTKKKASNRRTS
jgi:transcriptional regulator with XRE-family HTH domain